MEISKAAHLAELTRQQQAQDAGARQGLAAKAHLETLLEAHNRRVREFSLAVKTLAATDSEAQRALLDAITARNRTLGSD